MFLPKSIESILAFFGVLLSGNMYMPLDIKSPKDRLKNIICNIMPKAIITDKNNAKNLIESLGGRFDSNSDVIYLDSNLHDCKKCNCDVYSEDSIYHQDSIKILYIENLRKQSNSFQTNYQNRIDTDPAYIINTSGSTGIPKGVVVSHRSIIDYIEWIMNEDSIKPNENDIIGNQSPFYFDKSLFDIYPSIALGIKLFLIPEEKFLFPLELLQFVSQHNINYIYWVPSILKAIANLDLLVKCKPALNKIFFGGEAMSAKVLNYWKKHYPNAIFANLYGPSEITDICAYYVINREFRDDEVIPIGQACKNTQILLLDSNNNKISSSNTTGEIYIRGSCLSLQYYKDEERSKKAFIQNPLHNRFYDKVYKTGDLGYYNEYNEIVLVGRKDFQIKHNGYRIELGEIEIAFTNLHGLKDCCVLYDNDNNEIVLCYEGEEITKASMINYAKDKIPKYAMPTRLLRLDSMPLNANGKIDRQRLLGLIIKKDNHEKYMK
ncbi:AMP-binding protein [Helicobacter muridarum]|uniref:AMP-binding protein n=1 Tax=Helicobacter muridarum TaxID=216 RepID=UPI0022778214|nr:AMP-binding protein [Helicobacter muridarum]